MAMIQLEAGLAPSNSPAARLFFLSNIGFLTVRKKCHSLKVSDTFFVLIMLIYALFLENSSLPSAAVRMPQTMTMRAQIMVVGVSTLVSPRNTAVKNIAHAA